MWRIIRLLFTGRWHGKPKHICTFVPVETLNNKVTKASGTWYTSKVYVQRCTDCGRMYHYEVR